MAASDSTGCAPGRGPAVLDAGRQSQSGRARAGAVPRAVDQVGDRLGGVRRFRVRRSSADQHYDHHDQYRSYGFTGTIHGNRFWRRAIRATGLSFGMDEDAEEQSTYVSPQQTLVERVYALTRGACAKPSIREGPVGNLMFYHPEHTEGKPIKYGAGKEQS